MKQKYICDDFSKSLKSFYNFFCHFYAPVMKENSLVIVKEANNKFNKHKKFSPPPPK